MEQILYERPREKLRYRGARSLSLAELFQIVIGSGNSRTSVGKIARNVSGLINSSSVISYGELLKLEGLGDAKVCQILAVLELTRRLNTPEETSRAIGEVFDLRMLKKSKQQLLVYVTYDGSGIIIKNRQFTNGIKRYKTIMRRICAEAVGDSAAAIELFIGYDAQNLQPSFLELNFIKALVESANTLNINVKAVWLVNKNSSIDIRKQN